MPTKKAAVDAVLTLARPQLDKVNVGIVGETPIISNAFPRKALMAILAKHMQLPEAVMPLSAKNPVANYEACIHYVRDEEGRMRCAMPGASFKAALVAACRMTGGKLDMTKAKQLFQVIPYRVRIYGDAPVMCEHRVRNNDGVVDIRHRAMYCRWMAILPIRFHAGSISQEVITSLTQLAGFGCGIGDWRIAAPKSNNGQMGSWRLAEESDLLGEDFSEYCTKNPFEWEEMEQYGIVRPERVEYYAKCAALPRIPADTTKPKKGKKGDKKAPATVEAAMEVIHGVVPVNGVVEPAGYSPQE
jgi:hypothetical protein